MKFIVGLRKFTYGMVFLTVSLILLVFDVIEGADWVKYNKEVAVAFMATNVGEHLINLGKTWINDKLIKKLK